jgi:NADH-quinone oxidoreductase subunit N
MYSLEDFMFHAAAVVPEAVLAVLGMIALIYGVVQGDKGTPKVTLFVTLSLAVIAIVISSMPVVKSYAFFNSYVHDPFSQFMKLLVLLGGAASLAMSLSYNVHERLDRFEYPVLVLFSTIGMMFMISANSLMTLYVGLELSSLPLYVMAAMRRDNVKSSEAGIKYFVLGALSSGMLLYGISMIYGYAGTVNFDRIAEMLVMQQGIDIGFTFGLIMMVCGLAFKISAVPFHMWTPDVYEGAPTSVTAFFAITPKVAAMALITRTLIDGFGNAIEQWQDVLMLLSIASMIIGAFAAIPQNNIKRLMAYSSIGHMGYALIGLTTGTFDGVRSMIIYMAIYMIMSIGTFAVILSMRHNGRQTEEIEDLSGLSKTHPGMAFVMLVLMFSMAGIPPLAGFFGKLFIFQAAVASGFYTLAIIGVLSSVVAAYYYLRIVKVMYFDNPVNELDYPRRDLRIISGIATIFVVGFIAFPGIITSAAQAAASSLVAL